MKKLSKLTLDRKDVDQNDMLSKKELKSIMGGYGVSGGGTTFYCIHETSDGPLWESGCWMGLETAIAYCDAWVSLGYACKCISCG